MRLLALLLLFSHSAVADECGGKHRLRGIDVSSYQGEIDWKRVKAAGVSFAFARISDGLEGVDTFFAKNFTAMKKAGVRRGAYQYFRASVDPLKQADLVVTTLRRAGRPELPLVVDVENDDGEEAEVVRARLARWIARVERRTRTRPMIYTSPSMSETLGARFGKYPLWIAHYQVDCPTLPDGWTRWSFWQHSDKGRVTGVAGNVDLDQFAGTLKELRRLARR